MFRLYRDIDPGEFFVAFGDTAQGGKDKNFVQFLSKTKADFPLVYSSNGVAAETTPLVHQALEWIYNQTKVKPVFAYERNNGGASEMHRLMMMNRDGKYTLYQMKDSGTTSGEETSERLGWNTTSVSRPQMLGEWKIAFETKQVKIYDKETIEHHQTFIVSKGGKPEAAPGTHDDGVMSCAGAWQLYQTEKPPRTKTGIQNISQGTATLIY